MVEKIVVCSPQLGISPSTNSGGEVYDREMLKALAKKEVKVVVVLPKGKPYPKVKNLKVYYLPFPFIWPPYLFNFMILPWLFWLYKKEEFNVLRVHSPYFVGLGALIFKFFKPKVPLVTTYHHLEKNRFLFNAIDKKFVSKWDFIIADSFYTKREILKQYNNVDEKKIRVVYCGKDKNLFPKAKNKTLLEKYKLKDKKILLFLGEFKKRKNISFLLKLIKQLNMKGVKLVLCGDGRMKLILISRAKKIGVEKNIVFTGFVKEEKKVEFYNLADIFLFPSRKEGFGLPIVEAGSCRVPVIASKKSSLIELVEDGRTGYLAEFNNLKDWKVKVEKLLANDVLRKKMGVKAKTFADQFSWSKAAQAQIKIYQHLIEKQS